MDVVDLNCDMGESFGTYTKGMDEALFPYITSANIACGFHAGDPAVMRKTVKLALEHQVGIGAHPGLRDLVGFGRRNMVISPEEAYELIVYQIGALNGFVTAEGGLLQHVKPHGALYNMAAKNRELADAIAKAVYDVSPELILFGLAGSELIKAGEEIGLQVASEVFADRTYQQDGTLTSREEANSLITDHAIASKQVIQMIQKHKVKTIQQIDFPINPETICIHGDGALALSLVIHIHDALATANIKVKKISSHK
ncbi:MULTISPECIES: LamB/YcsF family protein [Paraliobacillus]|uniref:LamB/YcsF family protein n=1 Tax=Paraliobacillus TaxID=200903 RepID=UPI000DD30804|nr:MULTISPECIES: 5-oxoprolinase subunit PxpA [Paraliobacillus]